MLNLSLVKSLLAVVKTGSFREAATVLGVSQPAVSQHIRRLEKELGVALLRRNRRGCEATPVAQAFLPFAESLLRLSERAEASLRFKQLRIGASSNIGIYILQPLLKSFMDKHPDLDLDLVVDRNPAIAARLETADIDLALMEWWDWRNGFDALDWRRESVVLIVPPGHPLSTRLTVGKDDLIGAPMLGGEPGTGTGRLLKAFFAEGAAPIATLQLGSTEAVKQAVAAGLGISLVLASAVRREAAAGELCAIPFAAPAPTKDLYAVWSKSSAPQGQLPAFAQHLLRNNPIPGVAPERVLPSSPKKDVPGDKSAKG
jgi:DNA-binding transcriptional LysR family regulator